MKTVIFQKRLVGLWSFVTLYSNGHKVLFVTITAVLHWYFDLFCMKFEQIYSFFNNFSCFKIIVKSLNILNKTNGSMEVIM